MESQPQNPEFRINPENSTHVLYRWTFVGYFSVTKLANIYLTISLSTQQEILLIGYLCPSFYGINGDVSKIGIPN